MITTKDEDQGTYEFVCIEELVPKNHLLRKIEKHIDFLFIREKVRSYYCADNGRPSVDPVVLFKMIFLGYLYGIRSERQLEQEIKTNVAYRWFLGLKLTDPVPHHSTISFNRHKRFNETDIFQEIFDEIVLQAIKHRMVGGRVLFTDSTHIKANANKRKFIKKVIQEPETAKAYLKTLDAAIEEERKGKNSQPGGGSRQKKRLKKVPQTQKAVICIEPESPKVFST